MFKPSWNKILADLWENKARSLLVVLSIAVGVFAVGTIAGAYVMIPADMSSSYASCNPANIELWTDPFDADLIRVIGRLDGVAEAEGRRVFSVRLKRSSGEWTSLELIAGSSAEQAINRLVPSTGAPQPAERQVLLTTKTAEKLNVRAGQELLIELSDGSQRRLRISGTARDLTSGIGGMVNNVTGYIGSDTLEWLHQPATYNRLLVTVAAGVNDREHIQSVATRLADHLERSGRQAYRTQLSRRDEHPLESIVQALLGVLGILGVLVVFLSGSLIANTLSSLLAQHLRQIGVMKLIGAHSLRIIGLYLALILAFGAISLLIAIPSGGWAAYALSRMVANLVNFVLRDPGPVPLVPFAVILQVTIALVVPLLAGILPVVRGSRVSVQRALSGSAGSGGVSRSRLARALSRVRWLSRPLLISIRNTFRQKGRLSLTLFTLALGGAIFIAVFNNQVALNLKLARISRYFRADVNLDLARSYRTLEVERLALEVPGVERVETWTAAGAELLRPDGTTAENVSLLAPPADSDLVVPILLKGRWLIPGDENAITVSDAFWDDYPQLRPGDSLRLKVNGKEDDWQVVGIFQYSGTDTLVAYAAYGYLAGLLHEPHRSSVYRIVTRQHDLPFQQQVSARLDTHLRSLGLRVSKAEAGGTFVASVTELLGILTTVLLVMALLTALVGSIGLAGTLTMSILERTREIGVLRAVGADNRVITEMVIVEGLIIGLLSYVLGAVLSFPITLVLSNVISEAIFDSPADNAVAFQGFGLWLGIVLVLATVASFLPARNATRMTIREVLAYE